MTRRRRLVLAAAAVLLAAGLAAYFVFRPSARPAREIDLRFRTVRIVSVCAALLENPGAKTVRFLDAGGAPYRDYFLHAGLVPAAPDAPADIAVATAAPTPETAAAAGLASNGVLAVFLDVRGMKTEAFRAALAALPGAAVHVWMPGLADWVLAARRAEGTTKLSDMLDVFARETAFEDFVHAQCETPAEALASYVGTREELLPACDANPGAVVRPECFTTAAVAPLDWIETGDVEDEIMWGVARETRRLQEIRRVLLRGDAFAAQDRTEAAVAQWNAVANRNPRDTMLLDRLYQLAVNARAFQNVGNLKGAAKCYETMILVRTNDYAAVREYAACLMALGERDLARQVLDRAETLKDEIDTAFIHKALEGAQ